MLREKLLRLCFQLHFALEDCQFAFQTSSSESWELINVLLHVAIRYQAARVQYQTQSRVPRLSIYSPESVRHLPRVSGTSHLPSRGTCWQETSNTGCMRLALHGQRVGVSVSSGSRSHTFGVQESEGTEQGYQFLFNPVGCCVSLVVCANLGGRANTQEREDALQAHPGVQMSLSPTCSDHTLLPGYRLGHYGLVGGCLTPRLKTCCCAK